MIEKMANKSLMIPDETIMNKIYLVRGQKVMLGRELAELYGVETKLKQEELDHKKRPRIGFIS